MAPRANWKGFLRLSLVTCPVALYPATSDTEKVSFNQINRKTGQVISPGAVSKDMMLSWVKEKGVELRGAGTDESPHCYKRLDEVLKHHADSIRILHTLTPIGVAMAGEKEFDPYKD